MSWVFARPSNTVPLAILLACACGPEQASTETPAASIETRTPLQLDCVSGTSQHPKRRGVAAIDLGPGRCYGVNNRGDAVGVDDVRGPFVVDRNAHRTVLPLFENDPSTVPVAINDAGRIVGITQTSPRAIVYERGAWTVIDSAPGSAWTAASDINNEDEIVGFGATATAPGARPQFRALSNARHRNRNLASVAQSVAYAISERGVVVGLLQTAAGSTHAFEYERGRTLDLGTLGGMNSAAYGVNSLGEVVGVADLSTGDAHAFLFARGNMKDLGTLGGKRSDARGIDDSGHVVGNSMNAEGVSHPFIYHDGIVTDVLPKAGDSHAYSMARVERMAGGIAIGWGMAPDGRTHCIQWRLDHVQR